MNLPITSISIRYEHDVVLTRQRAREIGAAFGLATRDQARLATAVSEIVRNTFNYAGEGKILFLVRPDQPEALLVQIVDRGPGIPHLQDILKGRYVSRTGMGLGILGAQRLMDEFDIVTEPGRGTTVTLGMRLPAAATTHNWAEEIQKAGASLEKAPAGHWQELQQQNQELLATLDELQKRQEELARLNRELEDTNRGVVALYAEHDERADFLRRVSESKTQFLSNMTHEFRTPVNSILSLCRILLDRLDGDLTSEQVKQVSLIQGAANDLSEIVNDLLDLAKVEAGKTTIRPVEFKVESLFGALRGMLKPLLASNTSVSLTFEEPRDVPILNTDESKVSQILRNLISNALKFTESGEVRVRAWEDSAGMVGFSVSDTGIGILPTNQEKIFEEFVQVEGPHQVGKRGTGLGLPLSRKLARLLGGTLTVASQLGKGSTFTLLLPRVYQGPFETYMVPEVPKEVDPTRYPVLVVEDNRETMLVYEKYLEGTGFQPLPARTLKQARELLDRCRPVAIVLDILLSHENTWSFLTELQTSAATRDIPVYVVTVVENREKALALGARDFQPKPLDRMWLLNKLRGAPALPKEEVLVIDDEEASRVILRDLLSDTRFEVREASGGIEGVRLAKERKPAAVFLDLRMPDLDGMQVFKTLKSDPALEALPIVIHTARQLSNEDRKFFASYSTPVISKIHTDRQESMRRIRTALVQAGLRHH